ncbi:MAG TPA: DUF3180 domain-containing protein [Motilibacteraceae bacterium]|nr:DUF3180 domain-containing protein [Motilibacteraceae bacterium]
MNRTRPGLLVALVLGTALLVLLVVRLADAQLPPVPWSLPAALAVVDLGVLVAALSFRRRLRGLPGAKPYDPLHAARMVVLAKACSHAGAVLAGAYGGLALALALVSSSAARRQDALFSGLAALAALGLVAVGLLLERFCKLPPRDDADHDADEPEPRQHHQL